MIPGPTVGTASLRLCGGCARAYLGDDRQGMYICAKCVEKNASRPAVKAAAGMAATLEGRVTGSGSDATSKRYAILAVTDSHATVRPLGFPEAPSFEVELREVRAYR